MLYLAIDQHRKQLTVNLRNEQNGNCRKMMPGVGRVSFARKKAIGIE